MSFRACCVMVAILCVVGMARAADVPILEDDFSGPEIDTQKWRMSIPKTEGSFARIEDGALHVLAHDKSAYFATSMEIPLEHLLEFDYFQPSDERRGGYQNDVSYNVVKNAPEQKWRGAVWYIESSGHAYSHRGGVWGLRSKTKGGLPPARDKWYRIQVSNQATSTVIVVRDRETGELSSRTSLPHDPVVSGRICFTAGAYSKGSRWGFWLDNVRILSRVPTLGEPATPLAPTRPFTPAESWTPLDIAGREFWHLAPYFPSGWQRWGMDEMPLFADAAWLGGPADAKLVGERPRPFTMRPARTAEGREKQAAVAGAAGDCFLGFYPPLNEWGHSFLRTDGGKDRIGKKLANRDEGLVELERLYGRAADSAPIERAIFALDGYCVFHHHAFEWGARAVIAEVGETIPCTNMQLAFARGAAREYGRPWGIDLSSWQYGAMTHYVYVPEFITSKSGPFSGHSFSLHKRFCYAAWLAGANYIWYENRELLVVNENDVRQVFGYPPDKEHDRWALSPVGEVAEKLFALAEEKDRGVPCTPVAVMVDFAHGWSTLGCMAHKIWARLPLADGDHMMDEFFNTIFPWNPDRDYSEPGARKPGKSDRGFLTPTPYGDIFDVFTNKSCRTLDGYPVVIMLGDVRIDESLARRLSEYVNGGGTLVINARQVGAHLRAEFLGAELTGETASAEVALSALDDRRLECPAFDYAKVELGGARALVTVEGSGDVLACSNTVGDGRVILTTPPFLLDRENRALPLLDHLLRHVTSGLLPVRVSAGAEYLVNKTGDGWVVGLINNRGVYKDAISPPDIRPEESLAVMVRVEGTATAVEEWLTGQELEARVANGASSIALTIPPGDVRVLHIRMMDEM